MVNALFCLSTLLVVWLAHAPWIAAGRPVGEVIAAGNHSKPCALQSEKYPA